MTPTKETLELLEESFEYRGGVLYWKEDRPPHHFKNERGRKLWRTNFAGKRAGHIKKDKRNTYLRLEIRGKGFYVHRVVWFLLYGEWPDSPIDHINGDGMDNRQGNLRKVSVQENSRNRRLSILNTTGMSGVSRMKNGKYRVRGRCPTTGRITSLGCYEDLEDAIRVREEFQRANGFTERHGKEISG